LNPEPRSMDEASDIPPDFAVPTDSWDFTRRIEMIPMRDGVRLHTVILVPRNAQNAPVLLTRTPFGALRRTTRAPSPSLQGNLPQGDDVFVAGGYIRVFQDVRGKYGSEGGYLVTRPVRGPLNPSSVDHTTDAWDTVDWLSRNVPESNGRVGMIGSSYEGFTVVMALLDPHPALRVAAPESPLVDGWMGDDWFHNGAFRQVNLDTVASMTSGKGGGDGIIRQGHDDYENFRRAGSAGEFARAAGLDQLPFWRKLNEHPAYDPTWQGQALDRLLATKALTVPTLWVNGLWDQEDMWGAVRCYLAVKPKDAANNRNFLALGPWCHGQVNRDGSSLGPFRYDGDTALQFRRDVLRPFFDQHLKDGAPKADTPGALVYNTGENRWDRFAAWPPVADPGWVVEDAPLYLGPESRLTFTAPCEAAPGFEEYVSDPAKPVPHVPRPVRFADGDAWKTWLVSDQRAFADRPDVLVYATGPLSEQLRIAGSPEVNLFASTSGTDSDWVVKLIDVYPEEYPPQPGLGGYQLAVGMDIFRGRYRESFERPAPLVPGRPLQYRFALPHANHVFLPGHRIMVQVQSTWFPLYDRNPQTFVDNIFFAKPGDYAKAVQRIYHSEPFRSFVSLPVARRR